MKNNIWNDRWGKSFKQVNDFSSYKNSMGIVVKDLLHELEGGVKELELHNRVVADIGGGYGVLLKYLIPEDNEKHLIETSQSAIEIATKHYNISNTHFLDLTELPFPKDNYFDIVLCNEVFEHLTVKQISVFTRNIFNLLKPNGKLIISTPNVRSFTSFLLLLKGWKPFMFRIDDTHINPYTPKELNNEIIKCGFRNIKLYTTKILLYKSETKYFHLPFRWNLGEHIIGIWEK